MSVCRWDTCEHACSEATARHCIYRSIGGSSVARANGRNGRCTLTHLTSTSPLLLQLYTASCLLYITQRLAAGAQRGCGLRPCLRLALSQPRTSSSNL
jgi:hypothetical protein